LSIEREGPGVLFQNLTSSEAFRVEFSDRVEKLFAPGGAFYVNPSSPAWDPLRPENNVPASIYAQAASDIFRPLGPEVGRWGDEVARNGRLFLRHTEWQQTVNNNLNNFFPTRSASMLRDLRTSGFYRDAPRFLPENRLIPRGGLVEIRATGGGDVYYTLDGSDPRRSDGSIAPTAQRYQLPIVISGRTLVSARILNGENWSALGETTFYTEALPADVESLRITEVNYNPHAPLSNLGEADVDNNLFEFVELANISSRPVEMAGVQLVGYQGQGVAFTFGPQVLVPGGRVAIPRDVTTFVSRYGTELTMARGVGADPTTWSFTGGLGNDSEIVSLQTSTGQLIQRLAYSDATPWPDRADGQGSSLELVDPQGNPASPANYRASVDFGGSPGRAGSPLVATVRVNEVVSNPGDDQVDAVEFFNATSQAVNMSGWFLSDSNDDYRRAQIPPGTSIGPGGYLAFNLSELGLGLNSTEGDDLYLLASDNAGRPTFFIDEVHFDATDQGVALGRWPDGESELFPLSSVTLGQANTVPRTGELVLSEIDYRPADPDGQGRLDETIFEFVEVVNTSSQSIDLEEWQIDGDVQFLFSQGQLGAGSMAVVVPFDPKANPDLVTLFRLVYGAPDNLVLFGPWSGGLGDQAGTVRLLKPATLPVSPDAAGVLVDRVSYRNSSPWPTEANATGSAIHRQAAGAFGDHPASWTARTASPGSGQFVQGPEGDVNADGRIDVADIDRLCAAVLAGEPIPLGDLNRDGRVDPVDYDRLVRNILASRAGDANLDGAFTSRDLVLIFTTAEYEDGGLRNSTWAEGDWNCDGDFTSRDLVQAFSEGGYEAAAATAASHALVANVDLSEQTFRRRIVDDGVQKKIAQVPSPRASGERGRVRGMRPSDKTPLLVERVDALSTRFPVQFDRTRPDKFDSELSDPDLKALDALFAKDGADE
jgi:hypothetical protein